MLEECEWWMKMGDGVYEHAALPCLLNLELELEFGCGKWV